MSVLDHDRLAELVHENDRKIVLLVLDGLGDLRTAAQPRTALEAASKPHLDALATRGCQGRILPVAYGVTPGSGPGHLALFGYDPLSREGDIGRGVLEALGAGVEVRPGDVAVRGNFATADAQGNLVDRRAGRIPTEESRQIVERLQRVKVDLGRIEARLFPGEGHRFVLLMRGAGLSPAVEDTDPQELGVPPLLPRASVPEGEATAAAVAKLVAALERELAREPKANRVLLRGFSKLPHLPPMPRLYRLRCGCFAGYPLYRGVAAACGMEVVPCGKKVDEIVATVAARWKDFDFFFLHVKQTDQAGEDGNLAAKVAAIEAVDAALPRLLALGPEVIAVTGDHSTPAPMKAHSFHPVPLLLAPGDGAREATVFADGSERFDELAASRGHLGTFPSRALLALLLAHAGRLQKFGA
ncbi:MAG TPA: 2,3-bisphosphoglycerate-independent phosphoglycerate mutase [Thermoanaerobaculia bacterium]|jgi:2,3-bisphosphoglycerate-independent phosphoglycerate mutase|nr:2,3-bisphosphoglycerate-independent phosphoglycerate mutase [Thermoanaerobaculia bacterium]